jgi:hypothetical protein
MDVNRLRTGEKVAGISAIALLLIMFIFDWFSVSISGSAGGFSFGGSVGGNAWESFGFIDIILFITAIAAIALAVTSANATELNAPVALSAVVTGLGILSVLLVLFRIISPPDFGAPSALDDSLDVGRKIGVFLGLIATAGIAYGGWTAMQAEGESFGGQADRLRGGGDAPPPPPPPPASPPAGGTGAPPPSSGGPAA